MMVLLVALFLLSTIWITTLTLMINHHLAKCYFGRVVEVKSTAGEIQTKANPIANTVPGIDSGRGSQTKVSISMLN